MRVSIVHPGELGVGEIASWHGMQEATPSLPHPPLAHPFLSPEFALAAGSFRPDSRVAILVDGQRTVGFFPFEKRRFGTGVPIGGWLSACHGVVHAPGTRWDTGELLRACGLSAWRFDNLIAGQTPSSPHRTAIVPAPVIDLTEGFPDYYAKLRVRAPRFCREIERKARKLGREVGEPRLECDSRDPGLLSQLIAWKSEQYRRTSHVDRFGWPWVTGLLEVLLATRTSHLSGMLSVLYAGDQPVAIQFGLRADRLLVGWFTGYNYQYGQYSPGFLQIRAMAEDLGRLGIDMLHMGKGASGYTEALKNNDVMLGEGTVTGRSVLGAAHRVYAGVSRRALLSVREHRGLHSAADKVLRYTGMSTRYYGRV